MLESITKIKFLFRYHTWIQCYTHPKKERILFMRSKPSINDFYGIQWSRAK